MSALAVLLLVFVIAWVLFRLRLRRQRAERSWRDFDSSYPDAWPDENAPWIGPPDVWPQGEPIGSWYEIGRDGAVMWHLLYPDGNDMHEPSDGEAVDEPDEPTAIEREFADALKRTNEALAADPDQFDEQLASLVGVPEGIGPRVNPDCPICTGGRGLPCSWHPLP